MGDCGAHDPACAPRWAQTIGQRGRSAERDFLHPMDRVSVEGIGAGFEVFPKRWIAWISRNRRLARDFERYATTVTAFIRLAHAKATCCKRLVLNPIFSDGLLEPIRDVL